MNFLVELGIVLVVLILVLYVSFSIRRNEELE
jgi:hypothetical protein